MNWQNEITSKFTALCLGPAALIVLLGVIGVYAISNMGDSDNTLYEVGVVNLNDAATLAEEFAFIRATVRDMCLSTDQESRQKFKDDFEKQKVTMNATMNKLHISARGIPHKVAVRTPVAAAMKEYIAVSEQIVQMVMAGRNADAVRYMRTVAVPVNNEFKKAIDGMQDFMQLTAEAQLTANKALAKTSQNTMIVGMMLFAALVVVLGVSLANLAVGRLRGLFPMAGADATGTATMRPYPAYAPMPPPAAGGQDMAGRAAFCIQCGSRLQTGSRFCHNCGHGVGQTPTDV